MKRLVSTILLLVFSISSIFLTNSSSGSPDITKYAWPPKYSEGVVQQTLLGYSFSLVDNFAQSNSAESTSFIRISSGSQRFCEDFNDVSCKDEVAAGARYSVNQVLPVCADERTLLSCVEGLNIIHGDGRIEKLKFKGLIPGNPWQENTSIFLEAGSSSSLWISQEESNLNKGYKVTVSGGMGVSFSNQSTVSRATLSSFQVSVEPYEEITGPFKPEQVVKSSDGRRGFTANAPNYCLWVDLNKCGVQTDFNENQRIQIILHLPTEINGWLLGRLDKPQFSSTAIGISSISQRPLSRVILSGLPVTVPLISVKVDRANATPEMIKEVDENKVYIENPSWKTGYLGGTIASSSFYSAYSRFQMFEKYLNDKATISYPRWSVRSFQSFDSRFEGCKNASTESIYGIVTTNASMYQGSPPEFNGEEFTYKVAGLHKLPDDTIFKGSYDLALDSKFARCLYNFSSAPIRAAVEVTNADGSSNVTTSSLIEKDKWTYLSLKGFTFSQPTIKTKFLQEKVIAKPAPTPTITPKTTPIPPTAALKKMTITCVKGKTTKKVTAVQPKCPTGYKKK